MWINQVVQIAKFSRKIFLTNKQIRFLLVYSRSRGQGQEASKKATDPIRKARQNCHETLEISKVSGEI
jgi:hypothetical protein